MNDGLTGVSKPGSVEIDRPVRWPLGAVVLAGVWAVAAAGVLLLSMWKARPVTLCLFKRLTGLPCPTCGSGRAILALLRGQVMQAWLYNPLVFTLGAAAALALAVRIATGKSPKIELSQPLKRLFWVALALAVAANWIYLIAVGR
jgi:hypothetical protein